MKNILFLLPFVALFACTERIDLELNEGDNQKLVVDAWITNQMDRQYVRLTLTTSYYYNQTAPAAREATVLLSDEDQTYTLTEREPGFYYLPNEFETKIGHQYTLDITYKGVDYTASTMLNRVAEIDSVGYYLDEPEENIYAITLYAQEPVGQGDHYFFKNYKKGTTTADTLRNTDFASDEVVDGNYIGGADIGYEEYAIGDTVIVEMFSISQGAFDYLLAIMLETEYRGGPFDTPPANVPTNISGDAKGYFIMSMVSDGWTIIEE
ncbi:MAG: DUF4249 domain-containing protein [Bacteroidota bacterium]